MKKHCVQSILLALLAWSPIAADGNISVCPNTAYPTIQSGVNAASPGSKIDVCAARYAEQVTIHTNNLTLQARGAVILVPAAPSTAPAYGFLVAASGVEIDGFTITGFNSSLSAGIYVGQVNGTQLTDNLIYGNCNGIFLKQATRTTIAASNVSQNPFPPASAVIPQKGIPPPTPEPNCMIPNDSTTITLDGYGIQSRGGRSNQIDGNDLEQNGQTGVQLLNDAGGSEVSRNRLFANDNGQGGSPLGNVDVRSSSGATASISVTDNMVDADTIDIDIVDSDHVTVERNTATNAIIAVNVMDGNRNTIDHNTLTRNNSGVSFALNLSGDYNTIAHNEIANNDYGISVFSDNCPGTFGNEFSQNKFDKNPGGDIQDSTYPASCSPPPPPANYTPFTYDFYDHNDCDTSTPSNVCMVK